MAATKASDRAALLIYCKREEACKIKEAAQRERRTISGFVMNAVMSRFAVEGRLRERKEHTGTRDSDILREQAEASEHRWSRGRQEDV